MTVPGGYVAGDVLTAANVNLLPGGLEGGGGYASITSSQTGITAEADVTSLTVTWTAVAARQYKTTWYFATSSSVSGDTVSVKLANAANTQIGICTTSPVSSVYNHSYVGHAVETGLSGSTTRKLRAVRTDGTGNVAINASSTAPCWILVEDIGPA